LLLLLALYVSVGATVIGDAHGHRGIAVGSLYFVVFGCLLGWVFFSSHGAGFFAILRTSKWWVALLLISAPVIQTHYTKTNSSQILSPLRLRWKLRHAPSSCMGRRCTVSRQTAHRSVLDLAGSSCGLRSQSSSGRASSECLRSEYFFCCSRDAIRCGEDCLRRSCW
jgi:hypothetical protein